MMKRLFCILFIPVLLLMSLMVSAQDIEFIPQGINDPRVNDLANACYYGGTLSGLCDSTDVNADKVIDNLDTDWMWNAGWYLIRFEYNVFAREDFEPTYKPILPEDFIRRIAERDGCYGVVGGYVYWGGGTPTVRIVKVYQNDLCEGEFSRMDNVIAIESLEEADVICKEELGDDWQAFRFSRSFYQCRQPS